jgi:branched-chain amino acid transport system ATP-binding protein
MITKNTTVHLEINQLNLSFGGLKAVDNLTFTIQKNELLGLIGPNGAGKTTVFNMLSGFYKPDNGEIYFYSKSKKINTTFLSASHVNRLGLARTFQNIRLFKNITVLENVSMALQQKIREGRIKDWLGAVFNTQNYQKYEADLKSESLALLKIFNLHTASEELAGSLSYGAQRKLEIVRALATKPEILMLDEPAAGMNHQETEELNQLIRFVKDHFQLTVLLIEHDMKLVMNICDRLVVLNRGQKIAEGTPTEIRNSSEVVEAYLGKRKV